MLTTWDHPELVASNAATSPVTASTPSMVIKYVGTVVESGFVQTKDTARDDGSMSNCGELEDVLEPSSRGTHDSCLVDHFIVRLWARACWV
jgi:hypothetical protein